MDKKDFLVELGTEELPPLSLEKVSTIFCSEIIKQLDSNNLSYEEYKPYASPRRLSLYIKNLEATQPDRQQIKLGPSLSTAFHKNGDPTPAVIGFAKSCGINIEKLTEINTDKGKKVVHTFVQKGQSTQNLLPQIIIRALEALPIAKRMRWGEQENEFIRPVHWLILLFGNQVIPCTILGLQSQNTTRGHRFHNNNAILIPSPNAYEKILLQQGYVIPSFDKRRSCINNLIEEKTTSLNARAFLNQDLLNEVTALVEWPVALIGNFEEPFLQIPSEVLISSITKHQKCFPLFDKKNNLLPTFIIISNIDSKKPEQVISGNEKVVKSRLSDAQFFFELDCRFTQEQRREKLKTIIFQAQLGSLFDKTERIAQIARWIADQIGSNDEEAILAGKLCKSDLVSNMVIEFPELQGTMGQYYAKNDGKNENFCLSQSEQYFPRHAHDKLPQTSTGTSLSLADKIDTVTGIFGLGLIPTGNKDPFAIRRASIGILRILIEKKIPLCLNNLIQQALINYQQMKILLPENKDSQQSNLTETIVNYFMARLDNIYQEQGVTYDVIQSVKTLRPTVPLDFDHRIKAIRQFILQPEAINLIAANKRIINFLNKTQLLPFLNTIDIDLCVEPEEKVLTESLLEIQKESRGLLQKKLYKDLMVTLSSLQAPLDHFFDNVLINTENEAIRKNRFSILKQIRQLFMQVADISLLQLD